MTRAALIKKLSQKYPHLPEGAIARMVETIFDHMRRGLIDGQDIELRGFGTFKTKKLKARVFFHPQTGAKIHLKERRILRFKASASFIRHLNNNDE